MAPLSMLPGRVRLECDNLVGHRDACRRLETVLAALPGVRGASANHRTGRLLVLFDEASGDRAQLLAAVEQACCSLSDTPCAFPRPQRRPAISAPVSLGEGMSGDIARHMVLDMIAHTLLPSPLEMLLHPAVAAFRR